MPNRILIVDDERPVANTISEVLRHSGYDSTPVYNAPDALDFVRNQKPDLIICDVIIPGAMNGVDIAMACREIYPACRIVLLSGNAGTQELLEDASLQGHSFEVIAKPIPPRELLARIKSLLTQ